MAGRQRGIDAQQRLANIVDGQVVGIELVDVEQHPHHAAGAAQRGHFARARNPLQLGFHGVRHALQFIGAALAVFGPERERNDRHIVNALGLDQRLTHIQFTRQPVAVGVDGVIQPHQRFGARNADLELRRDDGHAWLGHRIHMVQALNLRDHLLGRRGHQHFHIPGRRARKRNQHVGHGDVDLRLFLARRHQNGKQAEQHRHQCDQRGELRMQKEFREATCNSHAVSHAVICP